MQYLLVRPQPSLRILFASPDLRLAGILQAPLLSQIGGSARVRKDLACALEAGRKVTARVHWISKPANDTRPKWIHCTPLLGINSLIAVWMIILVDDDDQIQKHHEPSVGRPADSQVKPNTAAVSPWESVDDFVSSKPARQDAIPNPQSPTMIQADIAVHDDTRPYNPNPTVPERNRIRKERQGTDKSLSKSSKDARTSATVAPFAANKESRYNVSIWSENTSPDADTATTKQNKSGRPRFCQSPDIAGANIPPLTIRPGPRINGKAYSFDSTSEHGISPENDSTNGSESGRPNSRSSSSAPSRNNASPINLPGQSGQGKEAERPPTRKTYKSLSPYGVLFDM